MPREEARIAGTVDYVVIPAPFPCSLALFTCPCGAKAVDDPRHATPKGWTTAADGSVRCPACSAKS